METQLLCIMLFIGYSVVRCDNHFPVEWLRALELLCPYNTICRDEPPHRFPNGIDAVGCCTDCSCAADCGLTESCCLPEMDTYHVVDRSHQQCLYPTTITNIPFNFMSYNMVVDRYPDGKGDDCGNETMPCGNNEFATPIGALYPVFSNKTGRIYKNMKCAICHGLNERDVIYFDVLLQCDHIMAEGIIFVDVSASFNVLENNKLAPNCNYTFIYPRSSINIKSEECFVQDTKCFDHFEVDSRLNMTKEDIRTACVSGFKSPLPPMYINIFCYVCHNHQHSGIITDKPFCPAEEQNQNKGILQTDFTTLLDFGIMDRLNQNATKLHDKRPETIACLKTNVTKQVPEDCRPVLCPTAQIRQHNEGCVFPSRNLNNNLLSLNLKLVPISPISEMVLFSNDTDYLALFTLHSPWKQKWKISTIVYQTMIGQDSDSVVDSFIVIMKYIKQHVSISKILSDIERTIRLSWNVRINNSLIMLEQTFSKYSRMYKMTNERVNPILGPVTYLALPPYISYETLPVFKILIFDRIQDRLPITKMFFCEQIELKSPEFEISLDFGIFYHVSMEKMFYQGEFSYVFGKEGQGIPRICIEDSGFIRQQVFNHSITTTAWIYENVIQTLVLVYCAIYCGLQILNMFITNGI